MFHMKKYNKPIVISKSKDEVSKEVKRTFNKTNRKFTCPPKISYDTPSAKCGKGSTYSCSSAPYNDSL